MRAVMTKRSKNLVRTCSKFILQSWSILPAQNKNLEYLTPLLEKQDHIPTLDTDFDTYLYVNKCRLATLYFKAFKHKASLGNYVPPGGKKPLYNASN